jgi:hypothetical protein
MAYCQVIGAGLAGVGHAQASRVGEQEFAFVSTFCGADRPIRRKDQSHDRNGPSSPIKVGGINFSQ